jgi:hypothetical protein
MYKKHEIDSLQEVEWEEFADIEFEEEEEKATRLKNYDTLRVVLIQTQRKYNKGDSSIYSARTYLMKTLKQQIFPSWYGTSWDFNGYTEKPLNGKIACGYFVTTTLKHIGFNLNRYKIAQQDAYTIMKVISEKIK